MAILPPPSGGFGQQQPMQNKPMGGAPALSTAVQPKPMGQLQPGVGIGQQPQKPVYDPRAYLNAVQQYKQSGSQGRQPLYTDFPKSQQPGMIGQSPMQGGLGALQPGMGGQQLPMNPLQKYMQMMQQQQPQGGQMAPGQPLPNAPQQLGGQPLSGAAQAILNGGQMGGQSLGAPNQQQMDAYRQFQQSEQGYGQQPPQQQQFSPQQTSQIQALNGQLQAAGKPGMLGYSPSQMQQQMGQQQMPPNPYAQQVRPEDQRMQAMRNLNMMNLRG